MYVAIVTATYVHTYIVVICQHAGTAVILQLYVYIYIYLMFSYPYKYTLTLLQCCGYSCSTC